MDSILIWNGHNGHNGYKKESWMENGMEWNQWTVVVDIIESKLNIWCSGWWYTYPCEKYWCSQLGWWLWKNKTCSKPLASHDIIMIITMIAINLTLILSYLISWEYHISMTLPRTKFPIWSCCNLHVVLVGIFSDFSWGWW